MPSYSPFNNAIGDLETRDLEALLSVPESWHIEYKRNIESSEALAKAVSAFANTHGGWLFVGVNEDQGPESTAHEFPGLGEDELSILLQRLNSSISGHLSPVPHYVVKVLSGPCARIGLQEDRSIVVIHVPMSVNTPHIHRNGCVYSRIDSSSHPMPLSDRHHLEELLRRGDEVRETTKLWVEADPEFSQAEAEVPYVRLMVVPDPWNRERRLPNYRLDKWREILHDPEFNQFSIPFDSIFPTPSGFVARHIHSGSPRNMGLTLTVYNNLSCDIVVPIAVHSGTAQSVVEGLGDRYEYVHQFVQMLESRGYWRNEEWLTLELMDLNSLLYVVISVINQYTSILKQVGLQPDFYFKARVLHAWRKVAFFDVPEIIATFSQFGVPMLMHEEITMPPGTDPDTFMLVQSRDDYEEESSEDHSYNLSQSLEIFHYLLVAFGTSTLTGASDMSSRGFAESMERAARRSVNINFGSTARVALD